MREDDFLQERGTWGGEETAGLSERLHPSSGPPHRDPTNSFKAYRKDFLDRTPIESEAGFSLGLELTVKAHFNGERVEELHAT